MSQIRWLHISDLHFNDEDASTRQLRRELPKFISRQGLKFDYIFCTGDIREGRTGVFTEEAADYLKLLCDKAGLDTSRLFIVPGNHDVDRNAPGRNEAIEHIKFQRRGDYDPTKGKIEDADLQTIHDGQTDFRTFLAKLYDADRLAYYENARSPHFVIETPDFNVIHVDSTLTYRAGQEATDLVIGMTPLLNALENCNPEKPSILLSHYPFSSLLQDEKKHVSEMLYRNGVRLWLAGHEHDHNLQPAKYLYSVQAGELRLEDRAHATVLMGHYDTDTMSGYISAYSWFPEGWAEYPIIWHDCAEENKFPFVLGLAKNKGQSPQAVRIQQANREYSTRKTDHLIESLLPNLEINGEIWAAGLASLIQESWSSENPHLILLADGGMGKSTMLLHACEKLPSALYIPLETLQAMGYGIEQYCELTVFEGNTAHMQAFTRAKHTNADLILLIDGLNEVDGSAERKYINEIKRMNLFKGIQFVISSRSDFTSRYSLSGYRTAGFVPLSDEKIKPFFPESTWSEIEKSPTLHHLMSNPMMVTMYRAISPVIDANVDCEFLHWHLPIKNATDLLYNHYLAQIAVLMSRDGMTGEKMLNAARCVFDVLPSIAYALESTYRINVRTDEFREMVKYAVEKEPFDRELFEAMGEYFRCEMPVLSGQVANDVLVNDLHLVYRGGVFASLPHQIYRDYLSAYWILKKSERAEDLDAIWNRRGIPWPVMEHIRNLSGRYWDGIAEKVHNAGKNRDDVFHMNGNLLDCFPYTEESGVPDYSGLDLRGLQLPNYQLPGKGISLSEARLDDVSLGKRNARPSQYTNLCFSEDHTYIAAWEREQVYIFSLLTGENVFTYRIGSGVRRLEFVGDYLLAVIDKEKIAVFKHIEAWQFVNEIEAPKNELFFNNRLKKIVLKDDILHFYFNSRERWYRLSDGAEVANRKKRYAGEYAADGYDLTHLGDMQRCVINKSLGVVCSEQHMGLTAVAKEDGSLTVLAGDEVCHVLRRGITLLSDGAISGNGQWAATLSHAVFGDSRKVQYWSLNEKKKHAELFCPKEIKKIHLSQNGNWVIGETKEKTWVLNVETGQSDWYEDHFISNQHSKLVTYGDSVLRKNNNLVHRINLKTSETEEIENLSSNAQVAVFMPDGSLASDGNNARQAVFKNSGNGATMKVNSQPASIRGLYSFKKQPFIAVATQDRAISIYHTRTGQRLRILPVTTGVYIVAVHPEEGIIAATDGIQFEIFNFYEKQYEDKVRGWWYSNPYPVKEHAINGRVLDLAFNDANHELVVILSNGELLFCHETYCRYHDNLEIITNFNIGAYDFRNCRVPEEIQEKLRQNGAII